MSRTVKEMTRLVDDAIKQINAVLESSWSERQLAKGKQITCPQEWHPVTGTILKVFRDAGWTAKMNVEITNFGREFVLLFTYPHKEE